VADHLESHQEEDLGTSLVHTVVGHREVVVVEHHGVAVPRDKERAGNLPEGHRNPADNPREEDRFGTGRVLVRDSDIHHEACH